MARRVLTPLRTSVQDIGTTRKMPDTPQTRSATYRLAFADERLVGSILPVRDGLFVGTRIL